MSDSVTAAAQDGIIAECMKCALLCTASRFHVVSKSALRLYAADEPKRPAPTRDIVQALKHSFFIQNFLDFADFPFVQWVYGNVDAEALRGKS